MLHWNSSSISVHKHCDGYVFGLRQLSCELACEYFLAAPIVTYKSYHTSTSNQFFHAVPFIYIYIYIYIHEQIVSPNSKTSQ
jgi:hypothetical protein